ncbi:MAG: hypothetical protein L0K86_03870 [Actinomycetia bacterium]|nr:hypothetical protein [Actinomycetes bacterium]
MTHAIVAVVSPVFVDDSGRRRRMLGILGTLVALGAVGYIIAAVIALAVQPENPLADTGHGGAAEDATSSSAISIAPQSTLAR